MPTIKQNITNMKSFLSLARVSEHEKIKNIIDMYEARKIPQYRTALNAVFKFANPKMFKAGEANKDYEDIEYKYMRATPITGKLKRERTSTRGKYATSSIEVHVILFTERATPIDPKTGLPDTTKEKAYEELMKQTDKKKGQKYFKGLQQVHIGTHVLIFPYIN